MVYLFADFSITPNILNIFSSKKTLLEYYVSDGDVYGKRLGYSNEYK